MWCGGGQQVWGGGEEGQRKVSKERERGRKGQRVEVEVEFFLFSRSVAVVSASISLSFFFSPYPPIKNHSPNRRDEAARERVVGEAQQEARLADAFFLEKR